MPYCCLNCFTDLAITELIQREGDVRHCSFCNSDDVLCITPDKLTGMFELVLCCLREVEEGDQLHRLYKDELKIISEIVTEPRALTNAIMGEAYIGKAYLVKDDITEYKEAWDSFKRHLIEENRFFPSNSLYGRIFVTDHVRQDDTALESLVFLRTVEALCRARDQGAVFYRARISENQLTVQEMGCPPSNIASAGRANPIGIPYLYLAEDPDTCYQEVRPSNGATIYLSRVTARRELKLVDLTAPKQKVALLKFDEEEIALTLKCLNLLQQFSDELSKPVLPEKSHLEYIPTQFICEYLRTNKGYDGIIFNSSYGSGKNVVLFSEQLVDIDEPVAHTVTSVEVHVQAI
jgi:hypothetical protein